MNNRKMELLAPAGSFDSMKAAFRTGADAVYMGGTRFGARAFAENADENGLLRAIDFAHLHDKKLYLTVNTLMKEKEIESELLPWLAPYVREGLDAVIVQDLGVIRVLREAWPDLPLHASTQMTLCGPESALLLKKRGVRRIVLPRELSLPEIRRVYEESGMDLEVFVHGALCCSYSGQCLMSGFLGGRSGNRGRCAQPCRLPYEGGKLFNMKDLCALKELAALRDAGAVSLKIEGRMKSPEYTGGVVSVYRRYLDKLEAGESAEVSKEDLKFLSSLFDRGGFTGGYFRQHNGPQMLVTDPEKKNRISLTEEERARLREQYLEKQALPAEAAVSLAPGQPLSLQLRFRGIRLTVQGDTVLPAEKKPLDEESVRKQLKKTGESDFCFEPITVSLEGSCFTPVSSLNALRRAGLAALEEAVLAPFRREAEAPAGVKKAGTSPAEKPEGRTLFVQPDDPALIDTVLQSPYIDGIYLPADYLPPEKLPEAVRRIHAAGKKACYALPYIFRKEMADDFSRPEALQAIKESGLDGVLLRSLDEAGFWQKNELPGEKVFDAGIYTWNTPAQEEADALGADRLTLPLEVHELDLVPLSGRQTEQLIYGRLPMMLSAQCAAKTTGHCLKAESRAALDAPAFTFVRDRTGAELPAESRCRYCYSVLYNAVPLYLADQRLFGQRLRICLTTESAAEAAALLERLGRGLKEDNPSALVPPEGLRFTRGNYKKGVQ
ncbi:MAG: U32 family peptidase [Lachnospiraceae bacterium]|nr:U32 family peptidase [Lachnospiraceae bacterium]